jgi:hypothetical protein
LEPDLESHSWPFFHRLVVQCGEFDPRRGADFRKRNITELDSDKANLNLKGLVQTRLAKSFSDAAIGETIRQLQYQAEAARRIIQRVGRFYPSSQLCSVCGYRNRELGLADPDWTCPSCDSRLDRDLNAAINIELEGLRLLAGSGYVGVTPVDKNPLLHNLGHEASSLDEARTKVCAHVSLLFR